MSEEKRVQKSDIQEEMRSCYLDYAMSVIIGRALPDVRDGLKPVHRRALFSMHSLNNYHNKPYLKSARIVGDVIGKYHPHGDTAVYNTIVRMAQDFSLRYPLVDGQGNFGSIDGDNPAAMRYTEVRMMKMSAELLKDIEKETVDWSDNYDGSLREPDVLPTRIPNLIVNGSAGIAVGMATNIPPHNLTEIVNALELLVKNPELPLEELLSIVPGPDFPTAGIIHGMEGIKQAYLTGKGVIQIRAKAEIEEKKGRERIIISEIPYQVNKARLIEKIATLVRNKELQGISDIRDESNRLGIRIVIELKKGEIGAVILNRLYKQTQMQTSFGIIFLAIHKGRPKVMNLKEMLVYFINHRKEVVIKRTVYELKKAKERAHILEGLKIAVENIDEIVELIKKSEGPKEAKKALKIKYTLSDIQAQAILDMKLQRITGLEREKIIKEYQEVLALIKKLEAILNSEELVNNILIEEFAETKKQYADKRKTIIIPKEGEIRIEDLIKPEDVIITRTHKGYIKRMSSDTYRSQKRGGKGVKGASFEDDFFIDIFTANTLSDVLVLTDRGKIFNLKAHEIPEGTRTAKGRNIVNLIPLSGSEAVKEILPLPENREDLFLVIVTERGLVKKTPLTEYKNVHQSGIKAIKIVDGDRLLCASVTDGNKNIILFSSSGKSIRFAEKDCRPQGRVSQGVKGMNISEEEKIIGMEIVEHEESELLSITENGYGKRTQVKDFRLQARGGKGLITMKLTSKNGDMVKVINVAGKDDLVLISNKGQVIRTEISKISLQGRNTQGVRLIKLKDEEKVVSAEKVVTEEEENLTES